MMSSPGVPPTAAVSLGKVILSSIADFVDMESNEAVGGGINEPPAVILMRWQMATVFDFVGYRLREIARELLSSFTKLSTKETVKKLIRKVAAYKETMGWRNRDISPFTMAICTYYYLALYLKKMEYGEATLSELMHSLLLELYASRKIWWHCYERNQPNFDKERERSGFGG